MNGLIRPGYSRGHSTLQAICNTDISERRNDAFLYSSRSSRKEEGSSKHNIFLLSICSKITHPWQRPRQRDLEEESEPVEMLPPLLPGHPTFPHFLLQVEGWVTGGRNPNVLFPQHREAEG